VKCLCGEHFLLNLHFTRMSKNKPHTMCSDGNDNDFCKINFHANGL